jgi:AbrB family looped-hinge helix DNA binding protein
MNKDKELFYGSTTIGEKGQVVIPAKARKMMDIAKGEKLLVFGLEKDMVVLIKLSNLEKFAFHLEEKIETMKKIMKKEK